jgi:D-alanine-D-alanine ligase
VGQVAVLFGGPAPEHDVSILTGLQASRELAAAGRDVVAIYWTKAGAFVSVDPTLEAAAFLDGAPSRAEPLTLELGPDGGFSALGRLGRSRRLELDAVVLCTHGGPGEDGTLQGALDLAGVRHAGPSVQGAALGMDKLAFAAVMAESGVAALPRVALTEATAEVAFGGPYIVKPRFGGSSIGIDVVGDLATARARLGANPHLAQGAVLEPFRTDLRDLQIAVRTHPALELSAIERPLRRSGGAEILDYADKYVAGEGMAAAPRELPAAMSDSAAEHVRSTAATIAASCLVRGIARIDFLEGDDEQLYANEINTIPGSLSRYLFIDPPRSFLELLDGLVDEAHVVPSHRYATAGADGTVLRTAGAIASKLA